MMGVLRVQNVSATGPHPDLGMSLGLLYISTVHCTCVLLNLLMDTLLWWRLTYSFMVLYCSWDKGQIA